ncbi:MAG TPA: DUF5946 family protein [Ardenticatenaceae bacterium]|nr:DUF5946 family protein [Ardenticatenaceae bacterium]
MPARELERCPGCDALLPKTDGPTHRYIGASPACWALFSSLLNAREPPLAPAPTNALLGDAYAAQHPGWPSDQAIQSVAMHLVTLHGVLERGVAAGNALWVRNRALRQRKGTKQRPFRWLEPPSFAGSPTVADIVRAPTPEARATRAHEYVLAVLSLWSRVHGTTIAAWYDEFVLAD